MTIEIVEPTPIRDVPVAMDDTNEDIATSGAVTGTIVALVTGSIVFSYNDFDALLALLSLMSGIPAGFFVSQLVRRAVYEDKVKRLLDNYEVKSISWKAVRRIHSLRKKGTRQVIPLSEILDLPADDQRLFLMEKNVINILEAPAADKVWDAALETTSRQYGLGEVKEMSFPAIAKRRPISSDFDVALIYEYAQTIESQEKRIVSLQMQLEQAKNSRV